MTDAVVVAYDHTKPGSPPQPIPAHWIGQPFAAQWSTDKPRVDKGAGRKPTSPAAEKE